jgi:hypothetical protein
MDEKNDSSLIKLNSGLLAALSSSSISINIMPREILVLQCIVAGTSFRDLSKIEDQLKAEVKIDVKREIGNRYDEFAVALMYVKSKIGYLPKNKNETIARLLDAGKQFYAILEAKEHEGNWLRLDIKVYLKD